MSQEEIKYMIQLMEQTGCSRDEAYIEVLERREALKEDI